VFCSWFFFLLFWWWGGASWRCGWLKNGNHQPRLLYTSLHTPMVSTSYIWTTESLFPERRTYRKCSETEGLFESIFSLRFFFTVPTSRRRSCSESNGATIQLVSRSHVKHIIGAKCIIMYLCPIWQHAIVMCCSVRYYSRYNNNIINYDSY